VEDDEEEDDEDDEDFSDDEDGEEDDEEDEDFSDEDDEDEDDEEDDEEDDAELVCEDCLQKKVLSLVCQEYLGKSEEGIKQYSYTCENKACNHAEESVSEGIEYPSWVLLDPHYQDRRKDKDFTSAYTLNREKAQIAHQEFIKKEEERKAAEEQARLNKRKEEAISNIPHYCVQCLSPIQVIPDAQYKCFEFTCTNSCCKNRKNPLIYVPGNHKSPIPKWAVRFERLLPKEQERVTAMIAVDSAKQNLPGSGQYTTVKQHSRKKKSAF
jgi:hypothetical protein